MGYDKLHQASMMGLPGLPQLPTHKYPCTTCQDANATRNPRPGASSRDTCDASFDLFDMTSCPTIGGQRYCTMICMRSSRYAFVFLHKSKDEIYTIWTKFMASIDSAKRPKTVRCDCAAEYVSPKFRKWLLDKYQVVMQNSNEHQQHQNGMAEKLGDTLVRRMRAGLLHSGLPAQFWGAAIIMAADAYNVTPHTSLDGTTPYHRHFGYHANMSYFRPLGCRCTVFRGKDLVTHRKISPRGLPCVYLGTGNSFGRKCFLAYCPDNHRVYATVDCQFDETNYPYRPQGTCRDYGVHDQSAHDSNILDSDSAAQNDDLMHAIQQLPYTNPTWSPTEVLTTTFDREFEDAMQRAMPQVYPNEDISDPDVSPPSAGNDSLLTDRELLDDAIETQVKEGEKVLCPEWDQCDNQNINETNDKQLVEYLMGNDVHLYFPSKYYPKHKTKWKFMIVDYELNRRKHMQVHVRIINSNVPLTDQEREPDLDSKLSVSQGQFNLRDIIKTNFPNATVMSQLRESSHIDTTTIQRTMEQLNKVNTAKIFQDGVKRLKNTAGLALGRSHINKKESYKTAFTAFTGLNYAETLCRETEADFAFITSAPKHYADARRRADCHRWRLAEAVEIKNCFDSGAFRICDQSEVPEGVKVMSCVFSYKVKTDSQGNETQCKARLNCDGRYQCESTYTETFAPTSRFTNIRTICAIAAQEGMSLHQFDVKSAFLIPRCKEDIYIQLPGEYRLPKGKVIKLLGMQYGLKNAAYAWNEHFNDWMKKHGFDNVDGDGVTFIKRKINSDSRVSRMIVGMHVDDGIVATNDEAMYDELIRDLQKDFTLSSHGVLEWYLGCKVIHDMENGTVKLSQEKYTRDVLERFNMTDAKPVSTPCEAGMHLRGDDCPPSDEKDPEVVRNYQACVGSLMYLSVFTRGECSFAVNQCARFLNNPGPSHIAAAKRILRYLAGSANLGLTYRRTSGNYLGNVLSATA